ncbi:hypothetical protein F5879DRAFT_982344 [Lentinula edodes]|nr:hypothetical protein F5879DRAFT_982344 [Lentinula edodes]
MGVPLLTSHVFFVQYRIIHGVAKTARVAHRLSLLPQMQIGDSTSIFVASLMSSTRAATPANPSQNLHDRVELAVPPAGSPSVDQRILTHSGPMRSPRLIRRVTPYDSRSPSPDPRFASSSPPSLSSSPSRPTISSVGRYHKAPSGFTVCIPRRASHISQNHVPASSSSTPRNPLVSELDTQAIVQNSECPTTSGSSRRNVHLLQTPQSRSTIVRAPATRTSSLMEPQIVGGDDCDEDPDSKIPKPPGEVNRPGRGGYNLRAVLNWSNQRFQKVKKFIDATVEDKLDCIQPISKQSPANIEEVHVIALQKFHFLGEYRDNWVIDDFIKCHLKYLKQALQKKAMKTAVTEARQEVQRAQLRAELAEKRAAAVARDTRQRGDLSQ